MSRNMRYNRIRGWIFLLGILVFLSPCHALSIVVGPYLQNPSGTSMTVMWITDQKCTSWVEYGAGDSLDKKAIHSENGLIDAEQTIHKITLNGLEPGTEYSYRICSKEILLFEPYKVTYGETLVGERHKFKTLDPKGKEVSFIVLNDIHQRSDLMRSLLKMAGVKPYDLVFLNGDILGHIEDEEQIITHILKPCAEIFAAEKPFVFVRGNHETRGKFARNLPNYLGMPGGRYYFSLDHGSVHFLVMDGGEDKNDTDKEYSGLVDFDRYRDEQTAWLEREIKTNEHKKAAFRIVLVHMPPWETEDWHGVMELYTKWRPLFNRGKVDLLISGHTHRYSILEPEKGNHDYPVIIGGGPKDGEATVIRVEVRGGKLEVCMTRDDGEKIGTYQLN